MDTILVPCRVPWAISPSMSGLTLTHCETDVEPECKVVCGGGRLTDDDRTDDRRIEIAFSMCHYARLGPHDDSVGVEAIGYRVEGEYEGDVRQYLAWRRRQWRATGICPDPGFYVARQSAWLTALPDFKNDFRHYLVDGRDGYVELISRGFGWREWMWCDGHRDDAPMKGPVVGSGEGPE